MPPTTRADHPADAASWPAAGACTGCDLDGGDPDDLLEAAGYVPPRVPAGQPGGGQFGPGQGTAAPPPDAHQQHVAHEHVEHEKHLAHVAHLEHLVATGRATPAQQAELARLQGHGKSGGTTKTPATTKTGTGTGTGRGAKVPANAKPAHLRLVAGHITGNKNTPVTWLHGDLYQVGTGPAAKTYQFTKIPKGQGSGYLWHQVPHAAAGPAGPLSEPANPPGAAQPPASHAVVEHHPACPPGLPHGVVRSSDQRVLSCQASPAEAAVIAGQLNEGAFPGITGFAAASPGGPDRAQPVLAVVQHHPACPPASPHGVVGGSGRLLACQATPEEAQAIAAHLDIDDTGDWPATAAAGLFRAVPHHPACPPSRPHATVHRDDDATPVLCHPSRGEAQDLALTLNIADAAPAPGGAPGDSPAVTPAAAAAPGSYTDKAGRVFRDPPAAPPEHLISPAGQQQREDAYERDLQGSILQLQASMGRLKGKVAPAVLDAMSSHMAQLLARSRTMQFTKPAAAAPCPPQQAAAAAIAGLGLDTDAAALAWEIAEWNRAAADLDAEVAAAESAGWQRNKGNAGRLREYWTHGEGGTAKIRWGTPGDFDRCVDELRKYVANPQGYCDLRHHDALGIWPAQHAELIKKGHASAGEPAAKYDPGQARDWHGKWTGGGGGLGAGDHGGELREAGKIRKGDHVAIGGRVMRLDSASQAPGDPRLIQLNLTNPDDEHEHMSPVVHPGRTLMEVVPRSGRRAEPPPGSFEHLRSIDRMADDIDTASRAGGGGPSTTAAALRNVALMTGMRQMRAARDHMAVALSAAQAEKLGPQTAQRLRDLSASLNRVPKGTYPQDRMSYRPGPVAPVSLQPHPGGPGYYPGRADATAAAADGLPALITIPGVDLLAAGTWQLSTGRQTFTRSDLEAAVSAAQCPAVGPPVIKIGHLDKRFAPPGDGDGEPAIGQVTNMRVNGTGTKLTGDLAGMPGWLGVIASSAYPRRSVEGKYRFTCQIGHVHPFIVSAVALLGVTPPGVGVLGRLDDIAHLYGMTTTAASAPAGSWRTPPTDTTEEAPVPVTEEDVRRAYYATAGLPQTMWITELQMAPAQLIVADGDSGRVYRVPFSINGDQVGFGTPAELAGYPAVAAARGSGPVLTWASAAESRSVITAAAAGGSKVSDKPWSSFSAADYTPAQYHRACLIHNHAPGATPDSKDDCKLPVREPDGTLNRNGIHAAAAVLAGGRGGVQASPGQKAVAKSQLRGMYKTLGEDPPDALQATAAEAAAEAVEAQRGEPSSSDPDQMSEGSSENPDNPDGGQELTHGPFTGEHTHPHAAYGDAGTNAAAGPPSSQGQSSEPGGTSSDSPPMHSHKHSHNGDANHAPGDQHPHTMNAAAPGGGHQPEGDSDVEFTTQQWAAIRRRLGKRDGEAVTPAEIAAALDTPRAPAPAAAAAGGQVGEDGQVEVPTIADGTYLVDADILRGYQERARAGDRAVHAMHVGERDTILAAAVKAGKFAQSRHDYFARLWDKDPEGTRKLVASLASGLVPVVPVGTNGEFTGDPDMPGDFESQKAYKDLYPEDYERERRQAAGGR